MGRIVARLWHAFVMTSLMTASIGLAVVFVLKVAQLISWVLR